MGRIRNRTRVSSRQIAVMASCLCIVCLSLFGCHVHGPTPLSRTGEIMHYLLQAEREFKNRVLLDRNGNGVGEFAPLSELLSAAESLGFDQMKGPALDEFRKKLEEAKYNGEYIVKVFVPADPDLAEEHVCVVAWPFRYREQKRRLPLRENETSLSIVRYLSPEPISKLKYGDPDVFRGYCRSRRHSGWGRGPKLTDIFQGEPFRSKPDFDKWETPF